MLEALVAVALAVGKALAKFVAAFAGLAAIVRALVRDAVALAALGVPALVGLARLFALPAGPPLGIAARVVTALGAATRFLLARVFPAFDATTGRVWQASEAGDFRSNELPAIQAAVVKPC